MKTVRRQQEKKIKTKSKRQKRSSPYTSRISGSIQKTGVQEQTIRHARKKQVNAVEQAVSSKICKTPIPPQKKKRQAGKFQLSDKSAIDEKENVLSMGEDILNRLKDCFGKVFDINDI